MSTSNSDSENLLLLPNLIQEDSGSGSSTDEKIHEPRFHTHRLSSTGLAITIRTLPSLGLSFQLWPSSLSLLSHFQSLLGPTCQTPPTNILELGSGSGLLGISLACLFSCHVTLTDLPAVLPNILFNASANSTAVKSSNGAVTVSPLRWGDSGDIEAVIADNGGSSSSNNDNKFDLVVASDVVYYEELVEPLIRTLQVFVKGETEFVMGHLRRWKRTDARFFKMARKVFDVEVVGKDEVPVEGWRHPVVVYRFTARKSKKKQ